MVDLHRHLDGSLRPATLAELTARKGRKVPPDLAFSPGMGLGEALARFAFTLSVLDDTAAVRRVAAEMCEDARDEGVDILEIRFAPQLHGPPIEAVVDAALEGAETRAGLILCGLYGEDPAVLLRLVEVARHRDGVVGIDLAGGPAPHHRFRLVDYAPAFRAAGEAGLGRTVHAGEGRPPAEIAVAITALGADRIGHGTTLLDDPAVLALVLERGVTIEACPTSNLHVGAIARLEDHPLPRWLALGVKACVCTDNTLLSAVSWPEEIANVRRMPGMTDALVARSIAHGRAAAFRGRKARIAGIERGPA